MSRNYVFILILLIFWGIIPLAAAPGDTSPHSAYPGLSFSIRYYDKRIYYLEQDPILVQITLTNNGPAPFRFKLADDRIFSVDFSVRTNTNRSVDAADYLVRRRSQSQQVYFREVSIEAGESFSFVEDLRHYAALTQSGAYVVQARIYPELYQTLESLLDYGSGITPGVNIAATGRPLESNRLALSLRPRSIIGPDGIPLELDVETNAVLVREKLPPDEVVSYTLSARQKGQWEKFFLYLDLEAMLARDAYRSRQYNAESEEGRQRMIALYKRDLQSESIERDIARIPSEFVIERTVYNPQSAAVTVLEFFPAGMYTERKRYTWILEKKDDVWTIVDYSVVNLGTE